MSTFGTTSIGASTLACDANSKYVFKAACGDASASLLTLNLYCRAKSWTAGVCKGIVYAESGGTADALDGATAELVIPAGSGWAWRSMTFTGVTLGAADDHFIGLICSSQMEVRYAATGGVSQEKADTYSDGPSDPFGTSGTGTRVLSCYVTYGTANTAPAAPTITSPATGANVVATQTNRVSFTFSDPDGDTQLKAELAWSLTGAGSWTTITNNSPGAYVNIPAGTFSAASSYDVKLRAYDEHGLVGPYCVAIVLDAIAAPAGPTMTAPASDDEVIIAAVKSVTWTVANQVSAEVRRVLNTAGEPDDGTVYETVATSGSAAVQAACRSLDVTFDTDGRTEHVQVRVEYPALTWSAWATVYTAASECRVVVGFAGPPTPIALVVPDDDTASIGVSAIRRAPLGSEGTASAADILRQEKRSAADAWGAWVGGIVGGTFVEGTFNRIAKDQPLATEYVDYMVASRDEDGYPDYDYTVRDKTAGGAYTDSGDSLDAFAWVSADILMLHMFDETSGVTVNDFLGGADLTITTANGGAVWEDGGLRLGAVGPDTARADAASAALTGLDPALDFGWFAVIDPTFDDGTILFYGVAANDANFYAVEYCGPGQVCIRTVDGVSDPLDCSTGA